MEFEFFMKDKELYKRIAVTPPSGSGWDYIKGVLLTVDSQLVQIRKEIDEIFGNSGGNNNLTSLKINDYEKQTKLDTLSMMRSKNIETKKILAEVLSEPNFIICPYCSGKMLETPLNISYQKYGNNYIYTDIQNRQSIEIVYMCTECIFAIHKNLHHQVERNKEKRRELLLNKESFVPNDLGFWTWINNEKVTKPKELEDEEIEPRERRFEYINIPTQRSPFVKITEFYPASGKIINIK